jgi:hypothetical protein
MVQTRGSLFRKYFLALFLAVVIPLVLSGASEAWFGYRDQRAQVDQVLGVEARSASSKIEGFLDSITSQLGWLVQLPWTDEADERHRIDALRLLRQVPAIVSRGASRATPPPRCGRAAICAIITNSAQTR